MEVILRETIDNLGRAGQIVKVADGYARNYLLPRKLAYPATAGNMKVIAPKEAKLNAPSSIRLEFSKLSKGVRYLGSVAYEGVTGMPPPTVVRVQQR